MRYVFMTLLLIFVRSNQSNDLPSTELPFPIPNPEMASILNPPSKLIASFDAGWQKRGTGHAYNSLSGHYINFVECNYVLKEENVSLIISNLQVIAHLLATIQVRSYSTVLAVRDVGNASQDIKRTTIVDVTFLDQQRRWSLTWP